MNHAPPVSAADALIARYARLPEITADAVRGRLPARALTGLTREDLVGAGNLGLVRAARGFEPERGNKFTTYAITRIRGAMLEMLRDWDPVGRRTRDRIHAEEAKSDTPGQHVTQALPALSLSGSVPGLKWGDESICFSDVVASEQDGPQEIAFHAAEHDGLAAAIADLSDPERLVIAAYYLQDRSLVSLCAELGVCAARVSQIKSEALSHLRADSRVRALFV